MRHSLLDTKRLQLHPTTIDDAKFLQKLMNTPKWLQFIGDRAIRTKEDAKNYIIDRMLPQHEKLGYGNFTVTLKSDGTKIGTCGLYDRPDLEGVDLGFAFLAEFEGQGFAFESASEVIRFAKQELGLRQLQAIVQKENLASVRLLEKLGFSFADTIILESSESIQRYTIALTQKTMD